ncbi:MAG TPA: hypothetical protein VIG90_09695 [Pedomonas sp.]|uniref:hypothetical protein n=1 Tax=Pedomonas sp. TaxID=2976421 RepID=UPI002F42C612
MHTRFKLFLVAAGLSLAGTAPAAAAEGGQKQLICSAYGKMGGAVADFILPLTFKQMLDMQHGRNNQLVVQLTQKLLGGLTGAEIQALGSIKAESRDDFINSVNQMALNLLQSGKAGNTAEVATQLAEHCRTKLITEQ